MEYKGKGLPHLKRYFVYKQSPSYPHFGVQGDKQLIGIFKGFDRAQAFINDIELSDNEVTMKVSFVTEMVIIEG